FECQTGAQLKSEKITDTKEENVTNALVKVTRESQKKVYFTSGHGENDFTAGTPQGYNSVRDALTGEGYDVQPLFLVQQPKVPDDAAALIVSGPKTDFFPKEIDVLSSFIRAGGHVLVQVDPDTRVARLAAWLDKYA